MRNFVTFLVIFLAFSCGAVAAPTYIDVTQVTPAAVGDARVGIIGCTPTTTGGATTIACPGIDFGIPSTQYRIFIEDGGGTGPPKVAFINGTSSGVGGAGQLTNAGAPISISSAFPRTRVTNLGVDSSNPGSNVAFMSTQTLTCCGGAQGSPAVMTVTSATTLNVVGGGSASVTCSIVPTNQTAYPGNQTVLTLTLDGTGHTPAAGTALTITNHGFATNDTDTYSSSATYPGYQATMTSCAGATGLQVALTYSVVSENFVAGTGIASGTSIFPCTSASQPTGTAGLQLKCNATSSSVSFGTDNTMAFQAALTLMNTASAQGNPRCIYIPEGVYLSRPLHATGADFSTGVANGYGCWLGDAHYHPTVVVVPNYPMGTGGDMFAWNNSTTNQSQVPFGTTQTFSNVLTSATGSGTANQAGSAFRNISVIGERQSVNQQNALMFYGATRFANIENCFISYMLGEAIGGGVISSAVTQQSEFAESRITNCHFDHDGLPGVPTVEFTSNRGEGSNNIDLVNLRFFDNYGPSLQFHEDASTTTSNFYDLRLLNIKFEESGMSALGPSVAAGDELMIGDNLTMTNNGASRVFCRNVEMSNPITGYAALHVLANANNGLSTGNIDCEGEIDSTPLDDGRGLQIDACQTCSFRMAKNNSVDYNLMIGSYSGGVWNSPPQTGTIVYDGLGAEQSLTSFMDPLTVGLISYPVRQLLASNNVVAPPAINSVNPPSTPLSDANISIMNNSPVIFRAQGAFSPLIPLASILRSGQTSNVTDNLDNATSIFSALGPSVPQVGQIYRLRVCNQSALYNETIRTPAMGNGINPAATNIVTNMPGGCARIAFIITSIAPTPTIQVVSG